MAIRVNDFIDTNKPQRDILLLGVQVLKEPETLKEIVGRNACVDALLVSVAKCDISLEENLNNVYPVLEFQKAVSHVVNTDKLLEQRKEKFGV